MNSSLFLHQSHFPSPHSTMNSTNASSSNPSKKFKLTIIPPGQLFVNISSHEDIKTTPSPTTTSSSPTPPNAPLKTISTNQTSSSQENTSSSFHSKLQISPRSLHEPNSPPHLNSLLDNISDVPSRPLNPNYFKVILLCISHFICTQSLLLITLMTLHHQNHHHNLDYLSWVILFSTTIMTIMGQLAYVVLTIETFSSP
ncbi:hypothetical protein Tco_0743576 [Tanacetum coccineum]